MEAKKHSDRGRLRRLAEAIADAQPIDWTAVHETPDLAAQLQRLRAIEGVSQLFHKMGEVANLDEHADAGVAQTETQAESSPPDRAEKPTWGAHVLMELIGRGAFGDVYRAYDSSLHRHIAIKLLTPEQAALGASTERVLDEARRLARVRHPNIITVHGVETHDGVSGIRTELLDGRTLEDCIDAQGLFSASEAALVGIELCGALAAIHRVQIVHGDIKTTNVIREQGGRIVLTDFGSAREERAQLGRAQSLTPLVTAPEVLHGDQPSRAADLYQLGVLLYRLVSGRYPVEAKDFESLRKKLDAGHVVPLRDRRPNVSAAFARVVSQATHRNPVARYATAGAMEEALQATLGSTRVRSKWASGRRRLLASLAAVAGIALAAFASGAVQSLLGRSLRMDTALYRVDNGGREPFAYDDSDPLRPGDSLVLTVESNEDVHVYVLNEGDREPGVVNTLFPDPDLSVRNPVTGGVLHVLPARSASDASWEISGTSGVERLLIIGSRQPLAELEGHIVHARSSSSSPGPFEIDPQRVQQLDLRSIELNTKTDRASETAFVYLQQVLARKAERGEVWYELVELRCEPATRRDRDASTTQGR